MNSVNPKISVIVPIYNCESYLSRCIDSILLQTFTDFELLLINDGSSDNSERICEDYARNDVRVKVFSKANGGVSSARNLGLDNAKGDWVTFVDSDDQVSQSYLKDMFISDVLSNTLIFSLYSNSGKAVRHLPPGTFIKDKMVKYIIDNKVLDLSGPYAKLYNRYIINSHSIRFPLAINMGEDGIFIINYLNVVDNLVVIDKSNYTVNTTEGSISSKYYDFKSEWRCYQLWKSQIYRFLTKYGSLYDDILDILWSNRIGETFFRCLKSTYMHSQFNVKDAFYNLKHIPKSDYSEFIKYFYPNSEKERIQYILIKHGQFFAFIYFGKILRFLKK